MWERGPTQCEGGIPRRHSRGVPSPADASAPPLVAQSSPHTPSSDLGAQYQAGPTGATWTTHRSPAPPFKKLFFLKEG